MAMAAASPNTMIKRAWTSAEDDLLVQMVERYGARRWSLIASYFDARAGKQCRERWVQHLQPSVIKGSWTEEEDRVIMQAVKTMGTKWNMIMKLLPGRTDNAIKNRWNSTMRKLQRQQDLEQPGFMAEHSSLLNVKMEHLPAHGQASRRVLADSVSPSKRKRTVSRDSRDRMIVEMATQLAEAPKQPQLFGSSSAHCSETRHMLIELLLTELQQHAGQQQQQQQQQRCLKQQQQPMVLPPPPDLDGLMLMPLPMNHQDLLLPASCPPPSSSVPAQQHQHGSTTPPAVDNMFLTGAAAAECSLMMSGMEELCDEQLLHFFKTEQHESHAASDIGAAMSDNEICSEMLTTCQ